MLRIAPWLLLRLGLCLEPTSEDRRYKEPNWPPAPKGPFNLSMRIYSPTSDAINGKWDPPPVKKVQ